MRFVAAPTPASIHGRRRSRGTCAHCRQSVARVFGMGWYHVATESVFCAASQETSGKGGRSDA